MRRLIVVAGLALVAVLPSAATAHQGNPNYRSVLNGITPAVPGVSISVLGYDNELQLINHSGKDVTILGYDGEPYGRVLADGTVEENTNSPATYLNEDRFAATPVPKFASSSKPPSWKVLDKTGRFIWHDHRMHWMGRKNPPQVKDTSTKTKIFDYAIPIRVASTKAKAMGTLFWVGQNNSFPVLPFAILALLLLAGAPLIVRSRRRRNAQTSGEPAADGHEPVPAQEAW